MFSLGILLEFLNILLRGYAILELFVPRSLYSQISDADLLLGFFRKIFEHINPYISRYVITVCLMFFGKNL